MPHNKPDKSQLLRWRRDLVTVWIVDQLRKQWPLRKPSHRPHSQEAFSEEIGREQVFEAIERLTLGND